MSLHLADPQYTIDQIVGFIKKTFADQNKTTAVIAVSGGIDSALSLALLSQALPLTSIYPLFLPYHDQSITDSIAICDALNIPHANRATYNIEKIVAAAADLVLLPDIAEAQFRKGNLMARARMMLVYDQAKEKDALVCGTENKSEHHLGYFTRFGDAASDLEPISQLYKTQVRQLVEFLGLPTQFLTKAPSAGLWSEQTDEQELGFSYEIADKILYQLIDEKRQTEDIAIDGVENSIIQRVLHQVKIMNFKLEVPYEFTGQLQQIE